MMTILLDEIKKKKPTAMVRGRIWEIIGLLSEKYHEKLKDFRVEVQDVLLYNISN